MIGKNFPASHEGHKTHKAPKGCGRDEGGERKADVLSAAGCRGDAGNQHDGIAPHGRENKLNV